MPRCAVRPDPRDLRCFAGGDGLRLSATPPLPRRARRCPPAPGRPSRSAWSRRSTPAARSTCSIASSPRSSASASAQQVIVDAVPGANTIVGADVVAKAAPDGYTFMITTMSTHVNNTVLFRKLPFDPAKDFAPITQVSLGSVLLTAPGTRGLQRPEGLRRLGPAAEPADLLRLVGHRLLGQRLRRDPGQGPRREPHPRALQRRAAGDHRRDRRQPRRHLRQPGRRQAAGAVRQAQGDRHDRPWALVGDARRADLRRAGATGASSCRSGWLPTRRPARPSRSSTACRRRSRR